MATGSKHRNHRRDAARVKAAQREAFEEAGEIGQQASRSTQERVLELFQSNGVVLGTPQRIARLVGGTPEAVQPVLEELKGRGIVEEYSPGLFVSVREARGNSTHTPSETIS